jgi:hypothetical protein
MHYPSITSAGTPCHGKLHSSLENASCGIAGEEADEARLYQTSTSEHMLQFAA